MCCKFKILLTHSLYRKVVGLYILTLYPDVLLKSLISSSGVLLIPSWISFMDSQVICEQWSFISSQLFECSSFSCLSMNSSRTTLTRSDVKDWTCFDLSEMVKNWFFHHFKCDIKHGFFVSSLKLWHLLSS